MGMCMFRWENVNEITGFFSIMLETGSRVKMEEGAWRETDKQKGRGGC